MSDEEEEVDLAEMLKEIEDEEMNEEGETEIEEISAIGVTDMAGAIYTAIPFIAAALGISAAVVKDKLKGKKSKEEVSSAIEDMKAETGDVSEELYEAKKIIKSLKSKINEAVKTTNATNLLNAKLLYTNKVFKSKNLNESQKVKVLSSFDKASTVKEAKLVYETLSEGLKVKKSTIRESLGRASKSTTIPTTKKPIVESNEVFARMQKLAGII